MRKEDVKRELLMEKPKVTRFMIAWDEQENNEMIDMKDQEAGMVVGQEDGMMV